MCVGRDPNLATQSSDILLSSDRTGLNAGRTRYLEIRASHWSPVPDTILVLSGHHFRQSRVPPGLEKGKTMKVTTAIPIPRSPLRLASYLGFSLAFQAVNSRHEQNAIKSPLPFVRYCPRPLSFVSFLRGCTGFGFSFST